MKESEARLRDLWHNIKLTFTSQGKQKENKILFEQIMAEKFPNLGGEIDPNPGSPENSK